MFLIAECSAYSLKRLIEYVLAFLISSTVDALLEKPVCGPHLGCDSSFSSGTRFLVFPLRGSTRRRETAALSPWTISVKVVTGSTLH